MSDISANIVVQPFDITINVDRPGITITPDVTDLNIYAVGGTNGVPAGNVGDIQYYAANGFAAIPSSVANYTGGNLRTNSSNLKISGGTNGYILQTDGVGNITWVAGGGSGNGVVGGSNTQIQYNNNGLFAGNAGFTFNNSTGNVNVPANLIVGGSVIGNVPNANFATYSAIAANANYSSDGALANLANVATIAGTVYTNAQPNITSVGNLTTLTVNGNLFAGSMYTTGPSGNISGANVITANTINANVQLNANIANITTLNLTDSNITNANITTAVITNANITTAVITTANVTTFNANGVVTLGSNANVRISGGSNGQILTTNGSSGLSWTTPSLSTSSIANGTSNVNIATANGNITMGVANVTRVTVTSTGANITGNLSASGIINGNILNSANGMTVASGQTTLNGDTLTPRIFVNTLLPIGNTTTTSIGAASQRFNGLWIDGNIEARAPGVANVGSITTHTLGNATGNITAVNTISGNIVNFVSQLSSNLTPNAAVSTTATHKIPIVLNGVTYYMMLTSTP